MDILHERQSLGQCQRQCWRSCWSRAIGKARGYVGMYTCMKPGTSRHRGCLPLTFPHRLRSQPSFHPPPHISMLEDVRPKFQCWRMSMNTCIRTWYLKLDVILIVSQHWHSGHGGMEWGSAHDCFTHISLLKTEIGGWGDMEVRHTIMFVVHRSV